MTDRELMEKILNEISGMKKEISKLSSIEAEQKEQGKKLTNLDSKVTSIESRIDNIEQNMVTKNDLERIINESQKDVLSMLQHIEKKLDSQTEQMDAKFEVLNNRLFNQETQLRLFKKQAQ